MHSMHMQMHVVNSFEVAFDYGVIRAGVIRAGVTARHTEPSGTELHRSVCLDSAIRPVLNKLELTVHQMRAGTAPALATNSAVERLFGRLGNSTRRKRKIL